MAGAARSVEEDAVRKHKRIKHKLDVHDVSTIEGMLSRGDRIVDIAYWYGVSPSTIHKIKKRHPKLHAHWTSWPELPPPGPYALVNKTAYDGVRAERDASVAMIRELEGLLVKYRAKQVGENPSVAAV